MDALPTSSQSSFDERFEGGRRDYRGWVHWLVGSVSRGARGGGLSFRLGNGNAKLFAEARYIKMYTKGTSTSVLPVTFGLRW